MLNNMLDSEESIEPSLEDCKFPQYDKCVEFLNKFVGKSETIWFDIIEVSTDYESGYRRECNDIALINFDYESYKD